MARIKNIDLPKNKRTVIGLQYIYGIGPTRAKEICASAGVSEDVRIKDLTIEEVNKLRVETDKYVTGGDLKREVDMNIKNLRRKRKVKRNIPEGQAHIHSNFNNTIVTITDTTGNVISWASSGTIGFKGSKKKTPFAAGQAAEAAAKKAIECGMKKVEVFVRGMGQGRETAIRSLQSAGLEVTGITDTTPVPHNGCRPPKRRRV